MNIQEARDAVVDHLIETDSFTEDYHWLLLAPDDEPKSAGYKAVRYSTTASKLALWDAAEVLYTDPAIAETVFPCDKETNLTFLGISAAKQGDIDTAYDFFERLEDQDYEYDVHILDGLLENGRLEEAEALIRSVDFSEIQHGGMQRGLEGLVYKLCQEKDGPKYAYDLVIELVPDPETSEIQDKKMERSRMDYFLEYIPIAAIAQGDFFTARCAVDKIYDWYGPGPASGGGGLIDEAYRTENPTIIASVLTLIYQKWGTGNAKEYLDNHLHQIDPDVLGMIYSWVPKWKNDTTAEE